ncbi:hypothetical protein HXX76_006092 [Chlamydomonas incerta]|uniref:Amine oxidase domain-containing protein n=1 Tax=Chlamydomonas incerta TaxID=51695 RepID=A0A835W1U0_CHLIN|nr:hypothetical protein HXX76_006092 [Chlamydomonas incerta]|eukprot:KAG2437442.1 hypothetical protein HXX76_006092 [Chlamydomonas incerta]
MESYHSVAVIGAGVAGLYAARLLKEKFPDVVVLEAQNRIGGRVKQVHGMAPWPIEAGPEFVHGRNSVLVKLAETHMGVTFTEKEWPDWWYFGKEVGGQGLINDEQVDDEVDKVHDLFGDCEDEEVPPPGRDVSAAEWMARKGCTPRQVAVADACYANDFGCSLRQLGLREMIHENKKWDSGETYLLMDRSMGHVVNHLAQGANIRTNWAVAAIHYGSGAAGGAGGVTIQAEDGRVVRCKACLVTVALPVLQKGMIAFNPSLPAPKAAAISRIRMGNAVKVIMAFSRRFWAQDMYDVVCPGAFVPEFWMLRHTVTDPGAGTPHCVVGFLAGERADGICRMDPEDVKRRFLAQLDEVFATPGDARPASSSLVKCQIVDWSQEKYVGGAYSYPTLGAEAGDRAALAAPVAGKLFFAGEATNEDCNPCIQGAMDTAARAATQIAAVLSGGAAASAPRSKL